MWIETLWVLCKQRNRVIFENELTYDSEVFTLVQLKALDR